MTIKAERGSLSGSQDDIRHNEILAVLYERHPESNGLLMELDDLFGAMFNEGEFIGVKRHGIQILQMIHGSGYQSKACSAPDVDTPGDDDWPVRGIR